MAPEMLSGVTREFGIDRLHGHGLVICTRGSYYFAVSPLLANSKTVAQRLQSYAIVEIVPRITCQTFPKHIDARLIVMS